MRLTGPALIALALAWHGRHLASGRWRGAKAYEFDWIASPLAQGRGYTFDDVSGWLGPYATAPLPTAWVEPAQTAIIAASHALFGDNGRLVLVLLNFAWFFIACLALVEIGRRLHMEFAGIGAAIALAAFGPGKEQLYDYAGNSAPASALMPVVLALAFRCVGSDRIGSALAVGASLGVLMLTHAGTLLLTPLVALFAGLESSGTPSTRARKGLPVLASAALVVAPWTARNWRAFGELVPVRTGLGQNLHYALPAVAQTYRPELFDASWGTPPWRSTDAVQAVRNLRNEPLWIPLVNQGIARAWTRVGPNLTTMNEAQRDKVLFRESMHFVRAHPRIAIELALAKLEAFTWSAWPRFQAITALALLGTLLVWAVPQLWLPVCALGCYLVPYLLSAPLYYRYRAPVEPLIFLLAAVPLALLYRTSIPRVRKLVAQFRSRRQHTEIAA